MSKCNHAYVWVRDCWIDNAAGFTMISRLGRYICLDCKRDARRTPENISANLEAYNAKDC